MIMHKVRQINMFEVEIEDITRSFYFKSKVRKVEKETLLSVPNTNYEAVLEHHTKYNNIFVTRASLVQKS